MKNVCAADLYYKSTFLPVWLTQISDSLGSCPWNRGINFVLVRNLDIILTLACRHYSYCNCRSDKVMCQESETGCWAWSSSCLSLMVNTNMTMMPRALCWFCSRSTFICYLALNSGIGPSSTRINFLMKILVFGILIFGLGRAEIKCVHPKISQLEKAIRGHKSRREEYGTASRAYAATNNEIRRELRLGHGGLPELNFVFFRKFDGGLGGYGSVDRGVCEFGQVLRRFDAQMPARSPQLTRCYSLKLLKIANQICNKIYIRLKIKKNVTERALFH